MASTRMAWWLVAVVMASHLAINTQVLANPSPGSLGAPCEALGGLYGLCTGVFNCSNLAVEVHSFPIHEVVARHGPNCDRDTRNKVMVCCPEKPIRQGPCEAAGGLFGYCKTVRLCPQLQAEFESLPHPQFVARHRGICGQHLNNQLVCCPSTVIGTDDKGPLTCPPQQQDDQLQQEVHNLRQQLLQCERRPTGPIGGDDRSVDCEDVLKGELKESGVYLIFPKRSGKGVTAYCEVHQGQVWTVILARHHQTPQENFERRWQDYKEGFGDPHGEYWLGNDNIHLLTGGSTRYGLRVEAISLKGEKKSAEWGRFAVADEANKYKLDLGLFRRSKSQMSSYLENNNEMFFSTIDRDNDLWVDGECVVDFSGGGWWFRQCSRVSVTAPIGDSDTYKFMAWEGFSSDTKWSGLSALKMMVRRENLHYQ